MIKTVLIVMILSILALAETLSIDSQIQKIQSASPQDRVKLMNEFKRRVAQMNAQERGAIIAAMRMKMNSHVQTMQMQHNDNMAHTQNMYQTQASHQFEHKNPSFDNKPNMGNIPLKPVSPQTQPSQSQLPAAQTVSQPQIPTPQAPQAPSSSAGAGGHKW